LRDGSAHETVELMTEFFNYIWSLHCRMTKM
jgi:hypothetical protein